MMKFEVNWKVIIGTAIVFIWILDADSLFTLDEYGIDIYLENR